MQWVTKYYKPIKKLNPKPGFVYISDYASIHNTLREKNCGTRISIDTTFFVAVFFVVFFELFIAFFTAIIN